MKTVLLVDLSSIFRAVYHASADGAVSVSFQGTLDGVRRAQSLYPGAIVGICADGRGNWRKALSAEYKAQREAQPQQMYGILDRVKTRLKQDGHLLWECEGFEADDLICTAAEALSVRPDHEVVIASADKDLFQLLCTNVRQLRTNTWQEITTETVKEKSGIGPHQFADMLALTGDKSDNVKGCDGVGEKTAAELLVKFGSLKEIFEHVETDPVDEPYWCKADGKPAVLRTKLLAGKENVILARKLVALRDDAPIKVDEIFEERKVMDIVTDEVDPAFADDRITSGKPANDVTPAVVAEVFQGATVVGNVALKPDVLPTAIAVKPANDVRPSETTALARTGVPFELGLEPQSLAQAQQLAAIVFNSRFYPKFSSEKAVLVAMVRGRELGLKSVESLDVFHWMEKEGKLALHAHLIISLAENHPDCQYIEYRGGDDTYAEYAFKNKKHTKEILFRYTIDDAVAAGITTKELQPRTAGPKEKDERGQWHKRRKEMLRKTAGVQGARIAFPRAALGLYSLSEMGIEEQ